jgi:hypothetical protein
MARMMKHGNEAINGSKVCFPLVIENCLEVET